MADLSRFVSTKGKDAAGNGLDAAKPLRTIQRAASDLKGALAPGQVGKIFVAPGLYEEVVVLTDNMQLLRKDSADQVTLVFEPQSETDRSDVVRIKRPPEASAPNKASSAPTWPEVIKINGKNVLLKGMQVEGDGRPQRTVFIHDSENVRVEGCRITGARTKILNTGGGTGSEADPFRANPTDEGEGGGMRIARSKKISIKDCVFDDNQTELKFEQAVKDRDMATLKSSAKFKGAVALGLIDEKEVDKKLKRPQPVRNGGGHLSCIDSDEIQVDNCFFRNGSCGGRGGAVQLAHNAYASFSKCLFENNKSGVDGGAVAFSDPDPKFFSRKPIAFTDCKFKDNVSGDDGGGAYFTTAARVTLTNCTFEGNRANSNGGGLRATFGAQVTLNNCTFSNNQANIDSASKLERNQDGGGAIAVANGSLKMNGGKIENNHINGFAGGGIYFIVAAYDENAERVAQITHGTTFDSILKDGYKVKSGELKVSDVIFSFNKADGETCYSDACTLAPRKGFKAGGAGGAIYVLGGPKSFSFPVNVVLDKVSFVENLSAHNEDKQKAELVLRNVDKLVITGGAVVVHASNKFALSLLSVADADLTASPNFVAQKQASRVFEEASSVKP